MTDLEIFEAEAITILRETSFCCNPVMMYSAGKDSSVLLHLFKKAFFLEKQPYPLLHIDTGWKFREMTELRDEVAKDTDIIVYTNPRLLEENITPFTHGSTYTDIAKTEALKQAISLYGFRTIVSGARRDEEKSRAKERIFSVRDTNHAWDPENQRPEYWDMYDTVVKNNESLRVFPLSNWTELDIWRYIKQESIKISELYFAKERPIVERYSDIFVVDDSRFLYRDSDHVTRGRVRFRTLGCYPLTGAVVSEACDVDAVITELTNCSTSERCHRKIDTENKYSMEMRKRDGYF